MRRRVASAMLGAAVVLTTSGAIFAGCRPSRDAAARNADSGRARSTDSSATSTRTQQETRSASEVRRTVQRFYDSFNAHAFGRAPEFTTEDWVHINPYGGVTHGRAAVLAELRQVHDTFLKGVTDTPDSMDVRFATPDVAIATVPGHVMTYVTPDSVRHENQRQIRTFVLVRRDGLWRVMQDQNTIRTP
jgi:uncharacterized protein (TIGR02246 family)